MEKNVGWVQVSMNNTHTMHALNCFQDLEHEWFGSLLCNAEVLAPESVSISFRLECRELRQIGDLVAVYPWSWGFGLRVLGLKISKFLPLSFAK